MAEESRALADDSSKRIARNAGWQLGGKGVGGLLSLVYLAIAARVLGVDAFGQFALILTYGQAIANLVQFQPWQVIVQYGATHLARTAMEPLARLIRFCVALDLASAVAGAVAAALALALAASLLGWSPDVQRDALLFAFAILAAPQSTPTGALRLLDRYDLAAVADTVTPLARLAGAVAAAAFLPTIEGFLVAWAVSELATALALWFFAIRELRRREVPVFRRSSLAGVTRDNPGIWRFAWITNLGITVSMVWLQIGTLAVGAFGGAATAGSFRLAFQFAQSLAKPTALLARSIYPEFARLRLIDPAAVRRVLTRTTLYGVIGGVALVLVAALAGKPFLGLVFGPEYLPAYWPLVLLTGAAALNLIGVAFEPALVAFHRPGLPLLIRLTGALLYLALLVPLMRAAGAAGAAWAALAGGTLVLALMAVAVTRVALLQRTK